MNDKYLCHYCSSVFYDIFALHGHVSVCVQTSALPLKSAANPWGFTGPIARAIIALAEVKDPNCGVTEDVDECVVAAYDYLGMPCPFGSLMLSPDQTPAKTLLMRIRRSTPPSTR